MFFSISLFIKFTFASKVLLFSKATSKALDDVSDASTLIFKVFDKVIAIAPEPVPISNILGFSKFSFINSIVLETSSSVSNLGIKTLLSTLNVNPKISQERI